MGRREETIATAGCGRVRFFVWSFQLHESEVRIGPLPEARLVLSYVCKLPSAGGASVSPVTEDPSR
jgi:hypothetical protein